MNSKPNLQTLQSLFLALFFVLTPHVSFAKKKAFNANLLSVVEKYKASPMVTMKVEKTVKLELMGKETNHSGQIAMSGEKFRLDTETPEKALLLFDGKTLWTVQYPPKELGGPAQVGKASINKKNKSQILLSALLDKNSLKKNFKILKEETKGDKIVFTIFPLTADLSVKSVDLTIDNKKKILEQVAYNDDVNNLTTMKFSEIEFQKKAKPELFKFQPPKDAQVTNL